jgi:hypothetical protein
VKQKDYKAYYQTESNIIQLHFTPAESIQLYSSTHTRIITNIPAQYESRPILRASRCESVRKIAWFGLIRAVGVLLGATEALIEDARVA